MGEVAFRRAQTEDLDGLVEMAMFLWPNESKTQVTGEMRRTVSSPDHAAYVGRDEDGGYAGFADFALRREYVPGATSSPVGYVEAIYVRPEYRRRGIGARLIGLGEKWAVEKGCSQIASDTWVWNTISQDFHTRVGFSETERVVYYIKRLNSDR